MAHFAQLDENNVVMQVIVVSNDELLDNGIETESKGIDFCRSLYGENTKWKQTSYNKSFRKNYAGTGYVYDESRDAFIPLRPYPSWTLNDETCDWEAPLPRPENLENYWNEDEQQWKPIDDLFN